MQRDDHHLRRTRERVRQTAKHGRHHRDATHLSKPELIQRTVCVIGGVF